MSFTGRAPDFRQHSGWPYPRKRPGEKADPVTEQKRAVRELTDMQRKRPLAPPRRHSTS